MLSFYHAGDIGDVILSMPAISGLSRGEPVELILGPKADLPSFVQPRKGITKDVFCVLAPLLAKQKLFAKVGWSEITPFVDYDLNKFRLAWSVEKDHKRLLALGLKAPFNLCHQHCAYFGVPLPDDTKPWLSVESNHVADVVFVKTERYLNPAFPWKLCVNKYYLNSVFLGLPHEYKLFNDTRVPYYMTDNLLEAARIIKGCKLLITNATSLNAIGEALKVNLLQCVCLEPWDAATVVFNRANATYYKSGPLTLPEI